MNAFTAVKNNVTARQAAEMYGIHVNRSGMAVCPFHADKNASMLVDDRFHCFGCQVTGDVIDFASQLFGLSSKEAAIKLAHDFRINYSTRYTHPIRIKQRVPSAEEIFQRDEKRCFIILANYLHYLRALEKQYEPHEPDEAFHPTFIKVMHKKDFINHLIDILIYGNTKDKEDLVTAHKEELQNLQQWLYEKTVDKEVEAEAQAKLSVLNDELNNFEKWIIQNADEGIVLDFEKWLREIRWRGHISPHIKELLC